MTEAEELELLELEEAEAREKARAPVAPPPEPEGIGLMGHADRTAANVLQGLSFNTAHRWAPEAAAVIDEAKEAINATSPMSFKDRVEANRKQFNSYLDPGMSAAGAMPLMMATGAPALNTLPGIASQAALYSAGDVDRKGGDLTSPEGAKEVGVNTAVTTAIPYGLKGLGAGLGWVAEKTGADKAGAALMKLLRGGYVKPTPEAERLAEEGVELTLGQMDPSSAFGRVEELAANKVTGGSLATARTRAANSARDILLRKAAAPGAMPPTAGSPVFSQVDELEAGYRQAYDNALAGRRVSPEAHLGRGRWRGLLTDESLVGAAKAKGAFELATQNPNRIVGPQERQQVFNWLEQQAKSLPKAAQAGGEVNAEHLQTMRSVIRQKARDWSGPGANGTDREKAEMLRDAANFVTELLEDQLPPDAAQGLRSTDAAYNNLRAMRSAADAANIQDGAFTPAQALRAIKSKGAQPGVDAIARDAQSVLSARYAPTGIQVAATEAIPGLKVAGPAWAALANSSPRLRAHALGQGSLPAWAQPARGAAEALGEAGSFAMGATQSPATVSRATALIEELLRRDPRMIPAGALASGDVNL